MRDRRPNVTRNSFPDPSRSRLCRLSALFQRVRPAQTQVDGPARSTPRHRDFAHLSLLRARLYSSWRRRPHLPASFATFAAYGDLATGLLAMLALLTVRIRRLFWLFVAAFNLVGAVDIILDCYHAVRAGLPALAGRLGSTYAIPVIYVPVLMITHFVAFYWLVRHQSKTAGALVGIAAAS